MQCSIVVFVLFLLSFSKAQNLLPYIFTTDESTSWGARCLDGSPSGFYFKNHTVAANQNKWIIVLEGGGYCLPNNTASLYPNTESCNKRATTSRLGSSTRWPSSKSNIAPSVFATYNQVFIPYCGGDLHSGTRIETVDGLYYAGHLNIAATFQKLKNNYNLNASIEIVFFGSSAGGIGVLVNADFVAREVPAAKVLVVSEAGWFLNVTTFNPQFISIQTAAKIIFQTGNGYVNQKCAAFYGADAYYCYSGNFTYQFISQRLFIANSIFDTNQLISQNGALSYFNSSSIASNTYSYNFGATMKNTLIQAFATQSTGLYITSSYVHGLQLTDKITGGEFAGVSYASTLINWFSDTGLYQVEDSCNTVHCNSWPLDNSTITITTTATATITTAVTVSTTSSTTDTSTIATLSISTSTITASSTSFLFLSNKLNFFSLLLITYFNLNL